MSVSKKANEKFGLKKRICLVCERRLYSPYYILNICSMEISNEFEKGRIDTERLVGGQDACIF